MKVKELIKELQKCDQEKEVFGTFILSADKLWRLEFEIVDVDESLEFIFLRSQDTR